MYWRLTYPASLRHFYFRPRLEIRASFLYPYQNYEYFSRSIKVRVPFTRERISNWDSPAEYRLEDNSGSETQSEYKHLALGSWGPRPRTKSDKCVQSKDLIFHSLGVYVRSISGPFPLCFAPWSINFRWGKKMNDYTRRAKLTVWMQSTPKVAWHSILFGNWLGTQKVRQLTVLPICYWQVEGPNKLRTLRPSRKSFR